VVGQPQAVGEGHPQVLGALPQLGRHGDLAEVEAARLGEREIVVEPAVDTRAQPSRMVVMRAIVPRVRLTG
jgi:hypothetical protein